MNDAFYIKRTLSLAKKAGGMTSPNPMVGAVLVKDGEIIAEDFHRKPGHSSCRGPCSCTIRRKG